MRDKGRLMITGIVALGAVAVTLGGHGLSMSFGDDDGDRDRTPVASNVANLKNFDGVTLMGPDNVVVTQGKDFAVRTEGDADALKQLNIYVKNGTLFVSRKQRSSWFGSGHENDATVRVTLPALARATLTGSGDMQIDKMTGSRVKAALTGPGNLVLSQVDAQDADFELTGSGDLEVHGKVRAANLSTTGSGDLRAEALDAETAKLRIIGSGNIAVRATRDADISIQGSGDAQVQGTTSCRITKMGSGEANCST